MSDETSGRDQEIAQAGECRALVAVPQPRSTAPSRPEAAFVTQLIACERRLGAYRTARRAPAAEASASYAAPHDAPVIAAFQMLV